MSVEQLICEKGDRVRCIKDISNAKAGEVYTVVKVVYNHTTDEYEYWLEELPDSPTPWLLCKAFFQHADLRYKIGDQVLCLQDISTAQKGKIYTINAALSARPALYGLLGMPGSWTLPPDHFELFKSSKQDKTMYNATNFMKEEELKASDPEQYALYKAGLENHCGENTPEGADVEERLLRKVVRAEKIKLAKKILEADNPTKTKKTN